VTENAFLHEAADALKPSTLDAHRAYRSLMEELEAIDWYSQRIDAAANDELKSVLAHNRDEEMEHAAMVLEWLRRREPLLDRHLRTYLFTERPLHEQPEIADTGAAATSTPDLAIGGLRANDSRGAS
jgi:ferritin-like protein